MKNEDLAAFRSTLRHLEERLARLEQKKLTAGQRIRLTEVSDSVTVIEADDQTEAVADLETRLNTLEDESEAIQQENTLVAGYGIELHPMVGSTQISLMQPFPWDSKAETAEAGNDFPFRVRRIADAQNPNGIKVHVCGTDSGTGMAALVYAGINSPLEVASQDFSVTESGFIYLRVFNANSSESQSALLHTELLQASQLPSPSTSQYIVPVARLLLQNGKLRIFQLQFGTVFIAGRII